MKKHILYLVLGVLTIPLIPELVKADTNPFDGISCDLTLSPTSNSQSDYLAAIDDVNTIAANINQSVGQSGRVTTVIQPVVNNVSVPTPVPQPTPVPVKGQTNTVVIDGKNNNTLAKLIR